MNLTSREKDGMQLAKEFYPTVAVENYSALLYDCLTKLASGEANSEETSSFTGEFEPASSTSVNEEVIETAEEKPEPIAQEEDVVEEEQTAPESSENESKVLQTIKKLDEGDGIYYDDLGIAVSLEGIDGPMLDEILDSLTDQGLIFQPRFNHYKEA